MSKPEFSVALALVERCGQWLVALRRADAHLGGQWEFPGGKIEVGETPETAAMREVLEECGVDAWATGILDTVSYEYPERIVHLTAVICRWNAGEAVALASEACRWVSLSELAGLDMPAVNARFIAQLNALSNKP